MPSRPMRSTGSRFGDQRTAKNLPKRSTKWCATEVPGDVGIPVQYEGLVAESWREKEPSLYGRFDLAFTGDTPKLLEYNADTPTSLLESCRGAVVLALRHSSE